MLVHLYAECPCPLWHPCRSQRTTLWGLFSPSVRIWFLGNSTRSLCFMAGASTWSILTSLSWFPFLVPQKISLSTHGAFQGEQSRRTVTDDQGTTKTRETYQSRHGYSPTSHFLETAADTSPDKGQWDGPGLKGWHVPAKYLKSSKSCEDVTGKAKVPQEHRNAWWSEVGLSSRAQGCRVGLSAWASTKANECDVIQSMCASSNAACPQREHYLPACYLPYLFPTKTFLLQTLIPEKCVFSQKLLDSFSSQCLITKLFLN